jgi:K+-transporting ATPase ATPase C chain
MKKQILTSLRMLIGLTVLLGLLYPLVMTVVAQLLFPHKANGSFIERDGKIIGSELIAQKFQSDRYFWPRPSSIDYNPIPSGATNFGPTSETLRKLVIQRKGDFIMNNHLSPDAIVPTEMLFASGSGIDPHISPDAALMQVNRIALARGFDDQKKAVLLQLVRNHIETYQFELFGEPRVNILKLNLELDNLK